jgi:anaerobic magnesium-protoporphyrin IX monomethyl ester cyclase
MPRVLLLNPPASQRVCRDLYCGHVAKGRYYWPQIDLLVLSGGLHAAGCELTLLDAIVDGLTAEAAHRIVDAFRPDVVVSLVAAISWSEDMAFLDGIRARHPALIVVSGDFARADPRRALAENSSIDAVVLEFADCDIVPLVERRQCSRLKNVYTRWDQDAPQPSRARTFSFPLPRHELYRLDKYHSPHVLRRPFTGVLTDYGCPYHCDYCYFERIGHKRRDLGNLREELAYVRSLGIREIILQDMSFGAVKSHALDVCEVMRSVSPDFSWVCEFRADSADEELLRAMKDAGCHTLMIGVESPNEEVMAKHHKPQPVREVEQAFALVRRFGFRTLAHFIIGLSGETPETIERLIRFSIDLDPDIASFNIARPAWDTGFRDEVVRNGWLIEPGVEIAADDSMPTWESPTLSRRHMWQLRNDAVRRFYLRPRYMLRQLGRVRTAYQLSILMREGWHIVKESARRAAPFRRLPRPIHGRRAAAA